MIYICGDSFAAPDPGHPPMWAELLEQKLQKPVTNLSQVCASNLLISQQVKSVHNADFVIVLFSASTRGAVRVDDKLHSFSWADIDGSIRLEHDYQQLLHLWQQKFFDIDHAVYESQCIIEATLQRLVDSGQRFIFDQGGFEHPSYGGNKTYFEKFNPWRSQLCLWDLGDRNVKTPSYHIVDPNIHQQIADYYYNIICENI